MKFSPCICIGNKRPNLKEEQPKGSLLKSTGSTRAWDSAFIL